MDKKIPQLDAAPLPVPLDWVFPVSNPDPLSGEAKAMTLDQLRTTIVIPAGGGIMVFYVDGNNTADGDGSILNPYRTLDLVYARVIGAGTNLNPDFPNVNIKVAAANYSTALNLWINSVTYTFDSNSQVTYTGSSYLIDLSVQVNIPSVFTIAGNGNFVIPNGGFIKNTGIGISQPFQKYLNVTVNNVNGYAPLGTTGNVTMNAPLIWIGKTSTGGGYAAPTLNLTINGTVNSLFQTVVFVDGSVPFSVTGTNPASLLNYARRADVNEAPNNGDPAGAVIRCINLDTSSRNYIGNLKMQNINVATDKANYVFYFEGVLGGTSYIRNVNVLPDNGEAFAGRVIEFGDFELVPYQSSPLGNFIIENLKIATELSFINNDVIKWTGTTAGKNKLDLLRCYLPNALYVNSNVNLNGNIGCAENIIRNKFHISNVPTFADNAAAITGGLTVGMVYRTSTGQQQIVF